MDFILDCTELKKICVLDSKALKNGILRTLEHEKSSRCRFQEKFYSPDS